MTASPGPETPASWAQGVAAVRRYAHTHGGADVPARAIAAGVPVGRWVSARREEYWSGLLSTDTIATLECLPGWVWGPAHPHNDPWHRGLAAVERYSRTQHTVDAPTSVVITGVRVRAWVEARRSDYRAGALTPDRIAALEGIIGWSWHARTTRWDRGLHAATTQIARHGHLTTTDTTVVEGFALGRWITRLRADHRAGTLTREQVDTLQALPGWVWGTPGEQPWRRGVGYLRAYAAEHGSAAPPLSVVVDTFPLGRWVAARRRDYHAGTLTLERIHALEALPGWSWQHHHDRWRQRLAELRDLVGEHGTVSAACTTQAGNPRLVRWVQTQRVAYRAGTLAPDRIHALEALPGWKWAPRQPHTRPG